MHVKPAEPYAPRPIRYLAQWEPGDGWRLKVYSIAHGRPEAREEAVHAALKIAENALPKSGSYKVGYLGVHDGRGAVFAFLDWWADENELHHLVWIAPGDRPTDFVPAVNNNPSVCVWDLAVQWHERQAWVTHVLAGDGDIEGYLAAQLNADV